MEANTYTVTLRKPGTKRVEQFIELSRAMAYAKALSIEWETVTIEHVTSRLLGTYTKEVVFTPANTKD